jgi:hypothetical protein
MSAQIRIAYPDGRTEERVLAFGTYIAGREMGDIVLGDPNTSGRHAQIDVQPGRVVITDLGSTNGTYDMQGQRLSGPYNLVPDQPVRLGTTTITLVPPQRTAAGTQVMPQMGAMPGVPAAPYAPPATAPYPQPAAAPQYGQPPRELHMDSPRRATRTGSLPPLPSASPPVLLLLMDSSNRRRRSDSRRARRPTDNPRRRALRAACRHALRTARVHPRRAHRQRTAGRRESHPETRRSGARASSGSSSTTPS